MTIAYRIIYLFFESALSKSLKVVNKSKKAVRISHDSYCFFVSFSVLSHCAHGAVMLITLADVFIREIQIRLFCDCDARMPEDAAEGVNVHAVHQAALRKVVSQAMRGDGHALCLRAHPRRRERDPSGLRDGHEDPRRGRGVRVSSGIRASQSQNRRIWISRMKTSASVISITAP